MAWVWLVEQGVGWQFGGCIEGCWLGGRGCEDGVGVELDVGGHFGEEFLGRVSQWGRMGRGVLRGVVVDVGGLCGEAVVALGADGLSRGPANVEAVGGAAVWTDNAHFHAAFVCQ